MNENCSIPGCGRTATAFGWCKGHYTRSKKYGDPLAGPPLRTRNGEPERYFREVVLTDERGVDDECLIWPYSRDGHGYGRVYVDGRMQTVSRMACEEVHGTAPSPDHDAAHSCGRGQDGCVTKAHLSWKTRADNMADQLIHGTRLRGERQNGARLSEAQARTIRRMRGQPQLDIAADFGVSRSTVCQVQTGRTWAWL